MKRQNGNRRFRMLGLLCLLLCALTFAPAKNAEAASAKSKALKAYKKFLTDSSPFKKQDFELGREVTLRFQKSDCKFALIYLNNDSVPELVIDYAHMMKLDGSYTGAVYTYKKGKVKRVGFMDFGPMVRYYKKKGVMWTLTSLLNRRLYYKMSGVKLKNISDREAKRAVGSKKWTFGKLHSNTAANRKKYLK